MSHHENSLSESKKTTSFETVDLVRILASFMVVFFHVRLPLGYYAYFKPICRMAVPFFFMVGGFFLYSPSDDKKAALDRIRKALVKIGTTTLFWLLIYAIFRSVQYHLDHHHPLFWLYFPMNKKLVFEILVYNRSALLAPIFWYLYAYLYVLLICWLLVRFDKIKLSYFLIPILLITSLILGAFVIKKWYYQGNWLFTGLPFVLAGRFLHEHLESFKKIPRALLWIMIPVGGALTVLESLRHTEQILYIGLLPLLFGIFVLAVTSEKKWPKPLTRFGRKGTLFTYTTHCLIADTIFFLTGQWEGWKARALPFLVFALSVPVAIVLMHLRRSPKPKEKV